jgi:hypothetical protein
MKLTRRKFLKALGLGAAALAATAVSSAAYISWIEPSLFHLHEQAVRLPRLQGEGLRGLRIAQISDIHFGGWMNAARLRRVTDLVISRAPDVIVITGDFLSRYTNFDSDMSAMAAEMERLVDTAPVFAVMGNHDHWHGVARLRDMLEASSVQELRNAVVSIKRSDSVLHLAGVDDVWEGHARLGRVLEHLPLDGAAVLLAHEPDFADTVAEYGRFDLQISGHTHGGQISLPFIGPPVLPHLGKKYVAGMYPVASMLQYTNRGVGMAVSIPYRFNCPPEITLFTLT